MNLEKRFLSLLLALTILIGLMPMGALAAEPLAATDVIAEKITIAADNASGYGEATKKEDGSYIFTVKATSKEECQGMNSVTTYTPQSNTITIANKSESSVDFSFEYEATLFSTLLVAGVNKDSIPQGKWEGTLEANASITLVIKSKSNDEVATLTLKNFVEASKDTYNVTVKHNSNGTITVNTATITQDTTVATTFGEGVAVTAVPNSGYIFLGWKDANGKIVSATANTTIRPDGADITVSPEFAQAGATAYWCANKTIYTSLNDACAAALTADGVVYLMNDGTLPSGEYVIPAGVTVLIPFDDKNTIGGANPEVLQSPNGRQTPKGAYRTLTLSAGVTLTVNGNLEVGAKHHASHGGEIEGGTPYDYYGKIVMENGSAIQVNNGGVLYAWGYITGTDAAIAAGNVTATVTAESGAKIYEKMQVSDYRGGTITSTIVPQGCFPFNQYYIQNVEVKEVLKTGSTLVCHAGIYGSGVETSTVDFMGSSSAMFTMGSNTTVTKFYDHKTDRLILDVQGSVSMNAISIMGYNTSEFILPFNSNMTINLKSGSSATVNQDIMLMPGATVNVDQGATMTLASGKKVYMMDADNWGNYCFAKQIQQISYVPYYNGAPKIRQTGDTGAAINLGDATINVNGTLNLNGQVYSTAAGAQIISTQETGVINFNAAAPTSGTSIKQSTINSTGVSELLNATTKVSVVPALLRNGDNSTVDTKNIAAGTTYNYCAECDRWYTGTHKINVSFVNEGIEIEGGEYCPNTAVSYLGIVPTKASDAQFSYVFNGWSDGTNVYASNALPNATANVTYTATYTATTISYQITWYNEDGTQLTTKELPYGAAVVFPMEGLPTKEYSADDCHEYVFIGWATTQGGAPLETIPTVSGIATYYAVFELRENANHNKDVFTCIDNKDGTHTKMLSCCGELVNAAENHQHVTYGYDETNHWSVCTCGAVIETVTHDFTNGDCVCGAKKPVEILYGDADGDGEITMLDAIILEQYLNEYDVTLDEAAADVDGDGEITMLDAIILQQYLNEYDVTLGPV